MFTYPQLLIPTAILTFFTYKQTFEAFTKIRCINKKDIAYSFLKRPDRKRQTRKENTITMVRKRCTNCFMLQESEVFDIQCLFFMGLLWACTVNHENQGEQIVDTDNMAKDVKNR